MKHSIAIIRVSLVSFAAHLFFTTSLATQPWPGEHWTAATKLTHLDTSFHHNMSGAFYNPVDGKYWVCCNGKPSAFWALRPTGPNSMMIDTNSVGAMARFVLDSGDLEGICQVDFRSNLVYLMEERKNLIKEFDVSTYGKPILQREWDISQFVPRTGGKGSEGITFVPNKWLKKTNFADKNGNPYLSKSGLGGLMLVAHQKFGRVYAFDLMHKGNAVRFVGAYNTSRSESSGLEFDRSSGFLWIWHNIERNYLEMVRLSSLPDSGRRRFESIAEFYGPRTGNLEGIAITPAKAREHQCLIVDDSNQNGGALLWFNRFAPYAGLDLN